MGKRGRGSETPKKKSVEGVEFFKVLIPNFTSHSHKLLIPPDFVKNFNKTMKERAILKNIHGKTWLVDVKATSGGVFFEGEWQNFVDYHGLKVGDLLVFRYDGSYSFIVTIFGSNGCKKESFEPINTPTRVKSEEETRKRVGRRITRHSERCRELKGEEVGASEQPEKEFDDIDLVSTDCTSFVSRPGVHISIAVDKMLAFYNSEFLSMKRKLKMLELESKLYINEKFAYIDEKVAYINENVAALKAENAKLWSSSKPTLVRRMHASSLHQTKDSQARKLQNRKL